MRILIVEDSKAEALLIEALFRGSDGFSGELVHVADMQIAQRELETGTFDIAFIDQFLGSQTGTSLIRGVGGREGPTPMILMSGMGNMEVVAEALAAGAMDYLDKDTLSPGTLDRSMKFALKNHEQALQARSNELYHREKALEARISSDEKSNFLANISHELRTPLNAIIGFSEVIQSEAFGEIGGDGATRYREYVDDIHRSGVHLLKLIDDLLDLSRIEAGHLKIDLQETSLNDVVDDALVMTLMQSSEKQISVEIQIPDTLPTFSADRRLLSQVVINLLSNAIKFTHPGGRIDVCAHVEGTRLVLTIEDDGVGVRQEDVSRLTESYFQSVLPGGEREVGTGLGLAVSKSIMETHLGGISIGNRSEGGARVKIWLPTNLETLNHRPS